MRDPHRPLMPTFVGALVWLVLGLVVLFVVDVTHRPTLGPIARPSSDSTVVAATR